MTNFSGGVRKVDATLAGASKRNPTTGSGHAGGTRGKREELADALNMIYDRRTGLLRRRNPHQIVTSLAAGKVTSLMPGNGFPAGSSRQIILSDGANMWRTNGGAPGVAILTGMTADSLWHGAMFPQSGGQGPMYMLNGVEARYWTGAAGAAWTAATGTLPLGKYIVAHGTRLWVLGLTTLASVTDPKSAIVWSELGDARNWPAANATMFDPFDGGDLTGAGRIGPYLLVFKRNKTWLIYDLDTSANRQLSGSIGCISHRSIVETPQGTFFMSERGPAMCDGSTIRLIEDKLNLVPLIDFTDTQQNLTRQVHAIYLNDDIYLNIGQYKASAPSHLEYPLSQYDVLNDAWWPHSKPQAAMCVWDGDSHFEAFGVDHDGNPNTTARTLISLFGPSVGSEFGTDWNAELTCNFRLRDSDFGSDERKRLRSISVEANACFDTQVFADGAPFPTPSRRDLTSAVDVQRAIIPRPATMPRVRRAGAVFSGGNFASAVTPGPFEWSSITLHADPTSG